MFCSCEGADEATQLRKSNETKVGCETRVLQGGRGAVFDLYIEFHY